MFLKGAIRVKKGPLRLLKTGSPWVFSNELVSIDKTLKPGSWVSLEGADGQSLGYGYFNPYSLIAFRVFERAKFQSEEQTRALFFKRLDAAWQLRQKAYAAAFGAGTMGRHSFRLAFGESDGVAGLIIDLYEGTGGGLAVLQCHSAGADGFLIWAQQWLEERMGISCGVIRNDLDVRRRENVELYSAEWGQLPSHAFALEGGVRFFIDAKKGQKTGYFYDHRDNRAELARRVAAMGEVSILDCFSYVGSWGLQALKLNPRARLIANDISGVALEQLKRNAVENGLGDRVETLESDFFKDRGALSAKKFDVVISDPPALTSSAKQAAQGRRALEACFTHGLQLLKPTGLAAFASCSFHLSWDEFLECVARAGQSREKALQITFVGAQAADHPILSTMPETRYLKCVLAQVMGY